MQVWSLQLLTFQEDPRTGELRIMRQTEVIDQFVLFWSFVLSIVLVRAQPNTLLAWLLTVVRTANGVAIAGSVRLLEAAACAVGIPLG